MPSHGRMRVEQTPLPGVLVIEPRVFGDHRGFFLEGFQRERYAQAGIDNDFVQDNQSRSTRGVLRGLHFQITSPQAKLLTVVRGAIFDVAVDLRAGSATFGRCFGITLSDEGPRQIFIPAGFGHGFCTLSEIADVQYRIDRYYDPSDEGGVLWSDPDIGIPWPIAPTGISPRDAAYPRLRDIPAAALPQASER
jgi:dTDP-4-dehydrorhamnose 3,5-epimerase